jgi:hypothetical protein
MTLPNIFEHHTTEHTINRLEKLKFDTKPLWGKMNASQMLAHVNVSYDLAYDRIQTTNSFFTKLLLKLFVKNLVVNEEPYKKNSRTAPVFLITTEKEFEAEKAKLVANIIETEKKGKMYFEGKESVSFGPLSSKQWSNMFSKHIDHHFGQFGI